jgi:hypothetical protein
LFSEPFGLSKVKVTLPVPFSADVGISFVMIGAISGRPSRGGGLLSKSRLSIMLLSESDIPELLNAAIPCTYKGWAGAGPEEDFVITPCPSSNKNTVLILKEKKKKKKKHTDEGLGFIFFSSAKKSW